MKPSVCSSINSHRPLTIKHPSRKPCNVSTTQFTAFTTHAGSGHALPSSSGAPESSNRVPGANASAPDLSEFSPSAAAFTPEPQHKSVPQKIKEFFLGSNVDKAKIANLGMGAFAAYGVVSNLNYGIAITISWLGFVKINGVSPLAPGQWKPFLAYYAGMWAIQNFARPMRLAAALALAPFFDRGLTAFKQKTGLPKGVAFAAMLIVIGVVTTSVLGSTLYLLGGFPPVK